MLKTKQEERDARIVRIVNSALKLPDEDQIYVLGITEGMVTKKSLDSKRPKKERGA